MSNLSDDDYEALLEPMAQELTMMARWVAETQQRLVVIFEGRDTAGKGGTIHAIARALSPRQCKVVSFAPPNERERGQWYFQRYIPHLPTRGEIALFDRSWYSRAGVERVMGFCEEEEAKTFLCSVPHFERQLVDDGILLFKYWLCCDQERQEERFARRLHNPLKRWKLSDVDVASRHRYADYTRAREDMLAVTHTRHAPWTLVDYNDQHLGRLTLLRHLLDRLPETELPVGDIDWPTLEGAPLKEEFGVLHPIPAFPVPAAQSRRFAE
jgi:polyphosphate kinase 2